MLYLTGASILALREHWHVTVICLQNGILLSLVRNNPKQWVDDYNRKVLNLPAMGGCASLAQKGPKRDAKGVQYMLRDRSLYRWGMISRSTKRESDPDPQHPMKQEITGLSCSTEVLLDLVKSPL
jgi:hypothetical protein